MSKFKAVVFDWAGTMIDFGSFAPMGVFVKAFEKFGITASIEQARAPMGAPKWNHISRHDRRSGYRRPMAEKIRPCADRCGRGQGL